MRGIDHASTHLGGWEAPHHLRQPLSDEVVERLDVRGNELLKRLRHMLAVRLAALHCVQVALAAAAVTDGDAFAYCQTRR